MMLIWFGSHSELFMIIVNLLSVYFEFVKRVLLVIIFKNIVLCALFVSNFIFALAYL